MKKALYGLKQAPRAWNRRIDSFLAKTGFHKCSVEHGMYVKQLSQKVGNLYICRYVDDLLITGSSASEIEALKESLKGEFEMTDLGVLSYFLGLEFQKHDCGLFMHQRKYLLEVLKKFKMLDCNPSKTPAEMSCKLGKCEAEPVVDCTLYRQIVGSLRFICHSRLQITFSVERHTRLWSSISTS